ncbi:hypothetical protein [Actinomadura sp. GTD37]|uniref:hypothetical protein n=1 Tax=Actinomadura sp. GTD37 TaxID=1778030 RepID=UPI0035BF16B3
MEKARALPELAILSTPANADGPHRKAVLTAFAEALEVADVYEWQSDFAHEPEARGEVNGLFNVLEARGFTVDDSLRQRITSCTDVRQIGTWTRRAAVTQALDGIFD